MKRGRPAGHSSAKWLTVKTEDGVLHFELDKKGNLKARQLKHITSQIFSLTHNRRIQFHQMVISLTGRRILLILILILILTATL
jgi:hypothetical protein